MLAIGDNLDGFEILAKLGSGATSCVYKSRHPQLGSYLAIKVLSNNNDIQANDYRRFKKEAQIACRLNHDNIARVFSFHSGSERYIVYELVEGQTIAEHLDNGRVFSNDEIVALFLQLCAALQHAHDNGVVHRDLKPSNIMLSPSGQLKLLDFGAGTWCIPRADEKLTRTAEVVGTPAYMSPEQCIGSQVDYRADLYSAGCILYELLEQRVPFQANNSMEMLLKHANEAPQKMTSTSPTDLKKIALRLLSKNPEERYQSANALSEALRKVDVAKVDSNNSTGTIASLVAGSGILVCIALAMSLRPAAIDGYLQKPTSTIASIHEGPEKQFREALSRNDFVAAQKIFDKQLVAKIPKQRLRLFSELVKKQRGHTRPETLRANNKRLLGFDIEANERSTIYSCQTLLDLCNDDVDRNAVNGETVQWARSSLKIIDSEPKKPPLDLLNRLSCSSAIALWVAQRSLPGHELTERDFSEIAKYLDPGAAPSTRDVAIETSRINFWLEYAEFLLNAGRKEESVKAALKAVTAMMINSDVPLNDNVVRKICDILTAPGVRISAEQRAALELWIDKKLKSIHLAVTARSLLCSQSDPQKARRILLNGISSLGQDQHMVKAGLYHQLVCLDQNAVSVKDKVIFAAEALDECSQELHPEPYAEITCYKMRAETLLHDNQIDLSLRFYAKTMRKIESWIGENAKGTTPGTKLKVLIETQLGLTEAYLCGNQIGKANAMLNVCARELTPLKKTNEIEFSEVKKRFAKLTKLLKAAGTSDRARQ